MSKPSRIKNLTYAAIAAQIGCISLIIIFAALFIGLWLDNQAGRRGPFTILLLVVSAPVNVYIMLRFALVMINRIQPEPEEKKTNEQHDHR